MEIASVVFKQTVIMFILMSVGVMLFKTKVVSEEGGNNLSSILIYVLLPSVIFQSFPSHFNPEITRQLVYSIVLSIVGLIIAMLVSRLIFKNKPIDQMGGIFPNAGFIGLPLVQTALGVEAVLFVAPYVALANAVQWVFSIKVLTHQGSLSVKKLLKSPVILSVIAGFIRYFLQIPLPDLVTRSIGYLAAMSMPASMIVLGIIIAKSNVLSMLKDYRLYFVSFVRLVIIPAITLAVFTVLPSSLNLIRTALLIIASAPVGSNVAMYAQIFGHDHVHAGKIVVFSTILSILTIPVMVYLSSVIWSL